MSATATVWRRRLSAALRISLACSIVALSTLYGPTLLRHEVDYPAFAYVTAVLIVSEATLGDTLRATWHALIGSALVVGPSIISLWLITPPRFTPELAALAVAVSAFLVALGESTPILAKRIAFGQMVIVYVGTVVLGEKTDVVMHPVHVAASTAVGAMSSIIAMLIPFPRLATFKMKRKCKSYAENATKRLSLLMKAVVDEPSSEESTTTLVAEIKSSSEKASRILNSLHRHQAATLWERLRLMPQPDSNHPEQRLQEIETTLKGMTMALTSQTPKAAFGENLKNELRRKADDLRSRIQQVACSSSSGSSTAPELKDDEDHRQHGSITSSSDCLPGLFMLQCMNNLSEPTNSTEKSPRTPMGWFLFPRIRKQSLVFAVKCSLSLGFAVLLGLSYNRLNGYWSGLTIAITFVTSRQATFSATNARAQGTALGTIYGVLGYFVCHEYGLLKIAAILPWIVFTTFLRHSRMYGEAGAISAVIAALLILGRKGYGTPTEFAIARLTEAFIGLSCFVIVEVLMRSERAAVLVKSQVSGIFRGVERLLEEMGVQMSEMKLELCLEKGGIREMNGVVNEMKRLVEEAKEEPNFWFRPFQSDCYTPLVECVTRMGDTLFFMARSVEVLCLSLQRPEVEWKGCKDQMGADISLFKEEMSSVLGSMQEAMGCKHSSPGDENENEKGEKVDVEVGKRAPNADGFRISDVDKEETEMIVESFLQCARDLMESGKAEETAEVKNEVIVSAGSVAFCMRSLVMDMEEVVKLIREIIRRENLDP